MQPTRGRQRGFSLIEMMIVMMIISLLATMAVARFMHMRDKSQVAAAAYDLDLVRKLLAYYAADWSTYPVAVASYADLQSQLIDADGNSLGELPYSNTFTFLSYALDANSDYIIRVQANDNGSSILRATPDAILRE
ncbi:prepilin-type N-terminal cleavage/methylation domain-containing protein [candidate division KSB1 bacterium]|nr:prepilin-type N-terminal cleavage/methylation domain-containing protein [candidate division KSB1 bacterium]